MRCPEVADETPKLLLERATLAGLSVSAHRGRLTLRGPRNCDQGLVESLLARKNDVMRLQLQPDADEREAWLERAAIAEYDGTSSRADAETLAWAELQKRRSG